MEIKKRIDELPVINDLGQITSIPVVIAGVTYQLDLASRIITPLQAQVNTLAEQPLPVLDNIVGTLDPTKVGPFSGGTNLSTKIAELDVISQSTLPANTTNIQQLFSRVTSLENRVSVLEAVPPSPSPPVIVTSPTVSWPGGSANVAETGTITNGTYSGTALNGSRTFQLINNSTAVGPRFSGSTTPAIPAQGTAQVIEYAPYGSAGAEVANPSIIYAVAAAPAPPPQVPVVATSPTLAFTGGGAPDVADTATITEGTYTGGSVTSRTGQVIINDVLHSTVANGATGNTFSVPVEAGNGARKLVYIEQAVNTAGPPVPNSSPAYTVNLPGVPVNTVAPQILPTTANESTLLVPTLGTYTVNGTVVDNSTLTFTYRWTFDWTMTGSLTGATSANFTANWLGTTGSYTVIFSDGSVKTTTLTNGSTAFSWTGAVTANSTAKVQVATTATLQLNSNNIGHAARFYVIPTGTGGAGAEVEASNTVTATGPATFPIGPTGITFTATSAGAGTIFAAVGASNSLCTLANPGSLRQAIDKANTNGAGSVVFLRGGTYPMNTIGGGHYYLGGSGGTVNGTAQNPIIVESYPGELAVLDGQFVTALSPDRNIFVTGDYWRIRNIRIINQPGYSALGLVGDNILVDFCDVSNNPGAGINNMTGFGTQPSNNTIRGCKCNDNNGTAYAAFANGGGSDGIAVQGGTNGIIEYCEVLRNSDDGIDLWGANGGWIVRYNVIGLSGVAMGGDGNGIKCGGSPGAAGGTNFNHNITYGCKSSGIDHNTAPNASITRNTSYNNGRYGIYGNATSTVQNNIASQNTQGNWAEDGVANESNNSWASPFGNAPTYQSTTYGNINFLRPTVAGGYESIGVFS